MKKHHKHHIAFFGGGTGMGTLIGIGTTLNTLLAQASQACTQLIESIF
ncbi:MAG: hypothetical protein ACW9W3_09860 [Candidatus Nitrosopumilus sp. bin_68KS]